MKELRTRVRRVIYAIGAFIIGILLLRFFFRLFGIAAINPIINFIYQLSYPFVAPFDGIVGNIGTSGNAIEFTTIIAILMWIGIIIIIAELVAAFIQDKPERIIFELVDSFFKLIEFMLFARLVLRAFAVPYGINSLVDFAYNISAIAYNPFAGIAPEFRLGNGGIIEMSTVVALVIVLVFDILSEGFFKSLFGLKDEIEGDGVSSGNTTVMVQNPGGPQIIQPVGYQAPAPQVNVYVPPTAQPVYVQQPAQPVPVTVNVRPPESA